MYYFVRKWLTMCIFLLQKCPWSHSYLLYLFSCLFSCSVPAAFLDILAPPYDPDHVRFSIISLITGVCMCIVLKLYVKSKPAQYVISYTCRSHRHFSCTHLHETYHFISPSVNWTQMYELL